jgi:hypothetical protein
MGEELQVNADLTPFLPSGAKGTLSYVFRGREYLRDEGHYDDCLFVDFDSTRVDYHEFVTSVFPAYLRAFTPYRAAIVLDDKLALEDWEEIVQLRQRTGKDVDGRDSVFRISPVAYFDRELCRRAFEATPEELVDALEESFEKAEVFQDGLLIAASFELLDREGVVEADARARRLLATVSRKGGS